MVTVAEAVELDLAELGRRDPAVQSSALAATALALARDIDDPETSPTARAACARSLRETLDRLRELAPDELQVDALDELGSRRQQRRAGGATS